MAISQSISPPDPDTAEVRGLLIKEALDVVVPASIFNAATAQKAPVLLWINGGCCSGGWKTQYGYPPGLLAESRDNGQQGVVYVAMNYRTASAFM
jgi:carboxylesterase type B